MNLIESLTCAFLVFVSGFMSSAEIALFSLSRFQIRSLKERFRPAHRNIKRLLSDPGGLLITILVTNEIVNISISTLIASAVSHEWKLGQGSLLQSLHLRLFSAIPSWIFQTLVGTLITAPIILIFCEITPKTIGARANQVIAPLSATPLGWIYDAFKPIRSALKKLVQFLSHFRGETTPKFEKTDGSSPLREEEFLFLVEEGHKEGAIHQDEVKLIRNIFEFDDTRVSDIYTPIPQVHSMPAHTTIRGALSVLRSGHRFSRIPVTEGGRRKIVGILYSKDLLLCRLNPDSLSSPISTIMRKPFTVNSYMRLNALFRKFKQQQTQIVVVEDTPGESLGIVTMRDVLDALFEDLFEKEASESGGHGA